MFSSSEIDQLQHNLKARHITKGDLEFKDLTANHAIADLESFGAFQGDAMVITKAKPLILDSKAGTIAVSYAEVTIEQGGQIICNSDVDIHIQSLIIKASEGANLSALGKDGAEGAAPPPALSQAAVIQNGKNGAHGSNGENGSNGPNVNLTIGQVEGTLTIALGGGKGGAGGTGQQGQQGGNGLPVTVASPYASGFNGGNGGTGGNGGNGGHGGTVTINCPSLSRDQNNLFVLNYTATGGAGGAGGKGGAGGTKGIGLYGSNGKAGSPGQAGQQGAQGEQPTTMLNGDTYL